MFRAHLSDPRLANDQHTMDEMTDRYRQLLRAEFCIVTGLDGRWISNPGWPVSDAPTTAVASTIASTLRGTPQRRVLAIRDRLFLVVAPGLCRRRVLGAMALASALDDGVAEEIAQAGELRRQPGGEDAGQRQQPGWRRAQGTRRDHRSERRPVQGEWCGGTLRQLGSKRCVEHVSNAGRLDG